MYFITHSFALKGLGSTLFNSFWQMALVWLAYIIITGNNKRFAACQRHALALIFLGAGSCWFIISLAGNLLYRGDALVNLSILGNASRDSMQPFFGSFKSLLLSTLPWLSFVYLGFLLFFIFRHAGFYLHIFHIRKATLQKIQPRLKLFTDYSAARMGIRRKVTVWISGMVDSPLTVGFLKPIILIPICTINHLSMDQVEAILLHELAHIRRQDYLINLLISWTGIIFFFNPFSRMLIQTIRKEREHCCDDLVLQFQYDPYRYAAALLSLEKTRNHYAGLEMAAAGRSPQLLLERVKRVTGQSLPPRRFSYGGLAFFLFSLVGAQMMVQGPNTISKKTEIKSALIGKAPIELTGVQYLVQSQPLIDKTLKATIGIKKQASKSSTKHSAALHEMVWVIPQDGAPGNENLMMGVGQTETRDFSIALPVTARAPAMQEDNSPYVPVYSFSYQLQDDNAVPVTEHVPGADPASAQAMDNDLYALKEIDWKEIDKVFSKNGKKLDIVQLKKQLNLPIGAPGWNKLNEDFQRRMSRADETRIREEIREELEGLKFMNGKDKENIMQLQLKILRWQLLMERRNLEKEFELMNNQPSKPNHRTVVHI